MSNYTKLTNFATKDSLASGNPLKVIKGTEIDDEFEALETAIETKANLASPTFTGTPLAPSAAVATNTTQIATTAFVKSVLADGSYTTIADDSITNAKMADDSIGAAELIDNSVGADALNVSGDGTSGQILTSDGDGSFSWTTADTGISNTSGSAPLYAARAWGNVSSAGNLTGGGNVSVSKTSTGQYSITFTTAMTDATYAVIHSVAGTTLDGELISVEKSTSSGGFSIHIKREETETYVDCGFDFVVFG